jgi:hypothetical protein
MANNILLQEDVKKLFLYKDGDLYWKVYTNPRAPIGAKAGSFNKHNQRRYIRINKIRYVAHRLIFLYHHGWLPIEVDHIDTCRTNNSIENLRAATSSQNQHNKRLQNNNTSGAKNVSYCLGRWEVKLKVNKKQIHIGRFDNFESAQLAAIMAREKYHGDFAQHG